MGKHTNQVVGLDIGSTKVSAVVGEIAPDGSLEIVGIGSRPARGMRKGVIVDTNGMLDAIAKVIEDAEMMAGTRIDAVHVGIGGSQVESLTTEVSMELTAKEVTPRDILRVIDMARFQTSSDQYEALHVVPLEYRVDELTGISNPIGKTGMKFGMWAQVITASSSVCTTLVNTLDQVKLEVQDITAHHVATARAVLTPDERDKGVLLLDVGGGTMDITVYGGGVVRHLSSVAVGGSHVTHDLAVGLRTPIAEAERIKRQYGRALQSLVDTEDMIDVQGVGGKEIQPTSRKLIGEIIECRVEEIFALALQRIQHYDLLRDLSAGAVITGGASVMPGMMQAAETILELPVRLGLPAQISGLTDLVNTPMYATAVGLALCGKDRLLEAEAHHSTHPGIAQAFQRIVAWVHNFF